MKTTEATISTEYSNVTVYIPDTPFRDVFAQGLLIGALVGAIIVAMGFTIRDYFLRK